MSIAERLQIYGPSLCPICGNHREIVFGRVGGELVCRDHPGHPLYGRPAPQSDRTKTPASQTSP